MADWSAFKAAVKAKLVHSGDSFESLDSIVFATEFNDRCEEYLQQFVQQSYMLYSPRDTLDLTGASDGDWSFDTATVAIVQYAFYAIEQLILNGFETQRTSLRRIQQDIRPGETSGQASSFSLLNNSEVMLSSPLNAAIIAATDNYIAGFHTHKPFTADGDAVNIPPRYLPLVQKWCCTQFMEPVVSDETEMNRLRVWLRQTGQAMENLAAEQLAKVYSWD